MKKKIFKAKFFADTLHFVQKGGREEKIRNGKWGKCQGEKDLKQIGVLEFQSSSALYILVSMLYSSFWIDIEVVTEKVFWIVLDFQRLEPVMFFLRFRALWADAILEQCLVYAVCPGFHIFIEVRVVCSSNNSNPVSVPYRKTKTTKPLVF